MSGFSPEGLGLGEAGLPLLRDLIHERMGLYYDNGRCELLAERVAPLVLESGFQSFLDFYYLLKYDEHSEPAWQRLMDTLSVPETYFWREIDQIQALVTRILPVLAAAGRPVRIWSVPCASGEEPLTIAMALEEQGWFERVPIEIYASDGSPAAIAKAGIGQYRERAFRTLPAALREKYFVRAGDVETPVSSLKARVKSWSVVNLMNAAAVTASANAHAIFCRNAFIYFSRDSVRRVVTTFADSMLSPGYLFVGASESLLQVSDRFVLQQVDGAFVYVKA
jgi:chemotaxis protein methyltransferase CheR